MVADEGEADVLSVLTSGLEKEVGDGLGADFARVLTEVVVSAFRDTSVATESRAGKDVQFGPLVVEVGNSGICRVVVDEPVVDEPVINGSVGVFEPVVDLDRMIGVFVAAD